MNEEFFEKYAIRREDVYEGAKFLCVRSIYGVDYTGEILTFSSRGVMRDASGAIADITRCGWLENCIWGVGNKFTLDRTFIPLSRMTEKEIFLFKLGGLSAIGYRK